MCPVFGGSALVERLPRDGLANGHAKSLVDILVHLVNQEKHGEVEGQASIAEIGETVEEIGVLATEVDGYDIALILDAFRDKGLRPGNIADDSVFLPGTESGREHEHVVLTLEPCLYHSREVATLVTSLVDGDADRSKAGKVHEEVVDEIAEPSVVVAPDNGTKRYTVFAAEGMIAYEGI